jgi:3-oxoacyl-[acyl-carrier-protein] synthase III
MSATTIRGSTTASERIRVGAFACVPGDVPAQADSILGFSELCAAMGLDSDFDTMGCRSFRKMSGPIEQYVADCVRETLRKHGTGPEAVDHIVFSTMDCTLRLVAHDFVARVLDSTGMVNCLPILLSHRQCCSSLTALAHATRMFTDASVENVVVVAFDFIAPEENRIRPFALFGDAVTACMVSRGAETGFCLASSSVGFDSAGLTGRDSVASRQKVAAKVVDDVYRDAGISARDVTRVFPANLFRPLVLFNAAVAGIETSKLHFSDTLARYGHCGNADWMMNLADYGESVGFNDGEAYLALASAQGFFACGLLVSAPRALS